MVRVRLLILVTHLLQLVQQLVELTTAVGKDSNDDGCIETAYVFVVNVVEVDNL